MTSPVHLKSVAALLILSAGLSINATSPADENSLFLLNYDIKITTSGSDDVSARIQQQGIRFGVPVQVEANTDGFSVDLALSISSR